MDQKTPQSASGRIEIMRSLLAQDRRVHGSFFPSYARDWKVDFASFRRSRNRAQHFPPVANDLIHVDNFPSRPSHGDRLLRIFLNIHPERPRVWVTSDSFEQLAWQYGGQGRIAASAVRLVEGSEPRSCACSRGWDCR